MLLSRTIWITPACHRDYAQSTDVIILNYEWFRDTDVVNIELSDHWLIKGSLRIIHPPSVYDTVTGFSKTNNCHVCKKLFLHPVGVSENIFPSQRVKILVALQ